MSVTTPIAGITAAAASRAEALLGEFRARTGQAGAPSTTPATAGTPAAAAELRPIRLGPNASTDDVIHAITRRMRDPSIKKESVQAMYQVAQLLWEQHKAALSAVRGS
jgi:hypothetical protein